MRFDEKAFHIQSDKTRTIALSDKIYELWAVVLNFYTNGHSLTVVLGFQKKKKKKKMVYGSFSDR